MSQSETGIGIYIHIPFCIKKCHYCDFASYSGLESIFEDYIQAVLAEIQLKSDLLSYHPIKTVFIGGGTPSLIPYAHIVQIMDSIRKFQLVPDAEITMEANPGTVDQEKMKAYAQCGINRLSFGLQAYQDKHLSFLGRVHSAKQFDEAIFLAKSNGFFNLNADIIFGIPQQTLADWKETLHHVIGHSLTHISCYGLKIEDGTEFGRLKSLGRINEVDDELDRQMYDEAIAMLRENGLHQYEISNFAIPGFECRHNMVYWERSDYLGLGAGAHSCEGGLRYANTPDVRDYIKGIRDKNPKLSESMTISDEEAISESMILGLRLNRGIDLALLSSRFGVDLIKRYREKMEILSGKDLVECTGTMVRLTKKGMDFANQVFVEFI